MMLPLQGVHLNELKRKDKNKVINFNVGCKVYNVRCPLHREGALVVDFSHDSLRFGRITADITEYPQSIKVEVVKDYRDPGNMTNPSRYTKPSKRSRSISHNISSTLGSNSIEPQNIESWSVDNVIFLDDMLDNAYRYELGVVVKVEKHNLIVCTDRDLIDKPYSEISSSASVNSLCVWKASDTHIFNEKNMNDVIGLIKYKLPPEPLKINSAVTGHKILAISGNQRSILSIVEKSNNEVTGAAFEFKGKTFKETEFKLPSSIQQGIMNNNFQIARMKHYGDLIVLTTTDGGETVFKKSAVRSKVLDAPAYPLVSAIRMFIHCKPISKINRFFKFCIMLTKPKSILDENDDEKYKSDRLLQHSLFYQRQNVLHVLAYEALYYGYKHDGIKPEEELRISKHTHEFVNNIQNQMTIIDYLVSYDMNGFTPIMYAISIRSYHIANVYVGFIMNLLLDKTEEKLMCANNTNTSQSYHMEYVLRAIFPHENYTPNNSIFYMLCANDVCTFTWSGPKHIKQDIYQCYTCSLSGKLCCCSQCASICHYGHNCLLMGASPTAYCDCWEVSHCKSLIAGDQEMRLKLFKYLVDNVDLFGLSCNERWDILVAFLLYTESRPDYSQKPNYNSSSIISDMVNCNSDVNIQRENRHECDSHRTQSHTTVARKDPLSADSISSTDLERITQRGLVHGYKISSVPHQFNFILAALEIILSNTFLVRKILTPRELSDDNISCNLVNEYSQRSGIQPIEDEIGVSHKQWDVRYVDSTVCYLIFKCKSDPLNRLLASLKDERLNDGNSKPVIDIFIRSVCRVYNIFVSGMAPILFKNQKILNYLNIFYDIFAIDPIMSITTLIKMGNAIVTPIIMNASSCQHNVNLSNNEDECIDKAVKMFILHPKISKNNIYNDSIPNRDEFEELVAEASSDEDDDETLAFNNSSENSVSYSENESNNSDDDLDDLDTSEIEFDSQEDQDMSQESPYIITHDEEEDYDSFSENTQGSANDEGSASGYSADRRLSEDGISENSEVSHLFDSEDVQHGEVDTFDSFNLMGSGNRNDLTSNPALTVIFNRSNDVIGNDDFVHISNPNTIDGNGRSMEYPQNFINNSNIQNNFTPDNSNNEQSQSSRLIASLNWAISNNVNRNPAINARDAFGRNRVGPDNQPRIITNLFQDSQASAGGLAYNMNRPANRANSLLTSLTNGSVLLTSNEASARSFAIILRTVTIIMKRFDMYNNSEYADVIESIKHHFGFVVTWLFRIMDYTEAMLRHGVATDYRLPKLINSEMSFLVQNYQQLHDTSHIDWNLYRRNSAYALGENNNDDNTEYMNNLRINFLSGILSLIRSCNNEHLYMMPKVDVSSMRYVAYIFDAFVYYMKEQKLNSLRFNTPNQEDNDNWSVDDHIKDLKDMKPRFFRRTESTLMLASMVPDEIMTPLRDAYPLAENPSLLVPTSTKKDLFGYLNIIPLPTSNRSNFPSKNPYSTNLFQYNEENISVDLFECDLVELYSRWNCCVTLFAKLFLKDVGAESGSSLLEIGHYDTKVRSFKRQLNSTMYKSFKDFTLKDMVREPEELLPITFEKLNTIFRQVKGNGGKIPRIIATFRNEPGEGQGVTRNFLNDVFLAVMNLKKLPDLKNVFFNSRSYLDFSLMDDEEFLDTCVLRFISSGRIPSFPISAPIFDEKNSKLNRMQQSVGRCIYSFLLTKNIHLADQITGIIVALPEDMIMRCVTCHHVLYNYIKEIQTELEVPFDKQVSKNTFYGNEEKTFDDTVSMFCETGVKCQYFPVPGNRSRERINAFINVGRLIGQCIVLDVACPLIFNRPVIKYLLGQEISWHDFAFYDGSQYESMRKMIIDSFDYEDKNEHLFDLYFGVEKVISGQLIVHDLIPNGRNIPVTPRNVFTYVEKYCMFMMVTCVKLELEAMKKGLNEVISPEMFSSLTAEDFKLLVNGCSDVTVDMLKKVTNFVVEASNVPQTRIDQFKSWFWGICGEMTPQQRSELLTFWTSSPNLSADYLSMKSHYPTIVIKYVDDFRLPTANTCSTKLFVPLYSTKKILRNQLLTAIKCRTFGFV